MPTKRISATAWGAIECAPRYLAETFLGATRDRRALDRGLAFHAGAEQIGKIKMAGENVSPEDNRKLVLAMNQDPTLSADIEESMNWLGERFEGVTPYAVEDDGGRWTLEIGGIEWTGKFDWCYLNEEKEGRSTSIEFKSGFVPDKEEAKKLIQNRIEALALMKINGTTRADVAMVSLGNRFGFTLEYDWPEIERVLPYLERDAQKIERIHDMIDGCRIKGGWDGEKIIALRKHTLFQPRIHAWCPSCAIRYDCAAYRQLVWLPDLELTGFGNRPEAVQALRVRVKLVEAEKSKLEKDLKADAADLGEVREGGFKVHLKTVHKVFQAKPAFERDEIRMVIELEEECDESENESDSTKPSGSDGFKANVTDSEDAPPSAKTAGRSETSSASSGASGGTSRTSSRAGTGKGGTRTQKKR